jgi:aldose 1-epimerase
MVSDFGVTADGQAVQAIRLRAGGLAATLLTWGAVLQDLRLDGVARGLTLGSDRLADYQGGMRHHGSLIGPVVNRITGARAVIDGAEYRFAANQDGHICLHGGGQGLHLMVWALADHGPAHAVMTAALPHLAAGFPGNRRFTARWEVLPPATLRLELTAETDAPTLVNLANHSYWNLDGTSDFAGHSLRVAADRFLPATAAFTPLGPVVPVGGTPMDFRRGARLAPGAPPLDTCFVLADTRGPLRDVLWLTGRSGVTMTLATTEPAVQVYDARNALRPGRGPYEGLAIEAQFWPDAPNHPQFPDITLRPGMAWRQVTEWRFAAPGQST